MSMVAHVMAEASGPAGGAWMGLAPRNEERAERRVRLPEARTPPETNR
jgi:hypothetical protein